jgi:hypothetical protein
MPHESPILSEFLRRDAFDLIMFGYVMGMRSGVPKVLPGVSAARAPKVITLEDALVTFARDMGLAPEQFNIKSQITRYNRMVKDFYKDQRTAE